MSVKPPFYLGPYKVVDELGAGGFATVFKAVVEGEMGFQRTVALKVLHGHVTKDDPQIVRMLADEARLMSRMQHPNIVYVQWFGQLDHPTDGRVFGMLMEYVQGRSLRSLLEELRAEGEPPPVSVVLDVYLDVARALAFAHSLAGDDGQPLHLVHRDLKPDNVMISGQGIVKLLDFGIAKATGRLAQKTATDLVRGTVQYMSPEQISGVKDLDFRSDLFSFGAMLWEALTNRRLIEAETVVAAIHKVASFSSDEALSAIANAPEGLPALLAKLLDPDRAKRPSSSDEVVDALQKIRGSVDAEQPTAVWLRGRVGAADKSSRVGAVSGDVGARGTEDTELVPSAGSPRVSGSKTADLAETETIDSSGAAVAGGLAAALDPTRSIPPAPFSNTTPRAAPAPEPVPPTRLMPSEPAPSKKKSMAAWIAVPILVAVGVVIGGLGLKALDDPPVQSPGATTVAAAAEPAPASTSAASDPAGSAEPEPVAPTPTAPAPVVEKEASPARVPLGIQKDVNAAMREAHLGMKEALGEAGVEVAAAMKEADAGLEAGSAGIEEAAAALAAVTADPEPPPPANDDGPPGRLRLSADHPFEVVVDGKTFTARDARRGIELSAGRWPVTVRCLQCPPEVETSIQQTITLSAGATETRVLKFPEAG